jgi:hypothetical protein
MASKLYPDTLGTTDVSRILKICPKMIATWIDSGQLRGWRVPGSRHRRTNWRYLAAFCRENGMNWVLNKCAVEIARYANG